MATAEPKPFSYAIYRLVPRVDRGEQINVGVVLFSAPVHFIGARTSLDGARARALWPELDDGPVRSHLAAIERVAAGSPGAGPIARLPPIERFGWLVAPASTIVQVSPVHTGICDDPAAELERLYAELVTVPQTAG
jgi:hypothetical protein